MKNENETLPLAKRCKQGQCIWLGFYTVAWRWLWLWTDYKSTDETILTALKNYGIEYNEELEKNVSGFLW